MWAITLIHASSSHCGYGGGRLMIVAVAWLFKRCHLPMLWLIAFSFSFIRQQRAREKRRRKKIVIKRLRSRARDSINNSRRAIGRCVNWASCFQFAAADLLLFSFRAHPKKNIYKSLICDNFLCKTFFFVSNVRFALSCESRSPRRWVIAANYDRWASTR